MLVPSHGRTRTAEDCERFSVEVDDILGRLGLERNLGKDVRGMGATRIQHLGGICDTERIEFTETQGKVENIREWAKGLVK